MAGVREFAVGVTVVPLAAGPERDVEPLPTDPGWVPETLPEMLPPRRTAAANAALLQQITAAEAMLAGLRVRAVLGLAAARPDPRHTHGDDEQRRPGELEGVSEFFA
ncbi:hypothetical protein, partial [Trujillonella humicola]|uniref:hypothetical protein n=1 Tax=Trujillonella humicola TaxID=3383699 RepID=UPI0039063445